MIGTATLKAYALEIAEFKRDIKRLEKADSEANALSIKFCRDQIKMRESEMGA